MHENGGVFQKKKMREGFADLVCVTFFVYGDGQQWEPPQVKNVINNVTVLAARFASQLHFNNVAGEFLLSYRRASRIYQRNVVMEMLASMVRVATGDFGTSKRHMERAKGLSNTADPRRRFYRAEVQELNESLAEGNFFNN